MTNTIIHVVVLARPPIGPMGQRRGDVTYETPVPGSEYVLRTPRLPIFVVSAKSFRLENIDGSLRCM